MTGALKIQRAVASLAQTRSVLPFEPHPLLVAVRELDAVVLEGRSQIV
jgi:hypothetical protein